MEKRASTIRTTDPLTPSCPSGSTLKDNCLLVTDKTNTSCLALKFHKKETTFHSSTSQEVGSGRLAEDENKGQPTTDELRRSGQRNEITKPSMTDAQEVSTGKKRINLSRRTTRSSTSPSPYSAATSRHGQMGTQTVRGDKDSAASSRVHGKQDVSVEDPILQSRRCPRRRRLAQMLETFRRDKLFRYFLKPVDVIEFACPDYYDVIKRPMDLATMTAKLENNAYFSDEQSFFLDLRQIFVNCRLYNPENEASRALLEHCNEAEKLAKVEWAKFLKDTRGLQHSEILAMHMAEAAKVENKNTSKEQDNGTLFVQNSRSATKVKRDCIEARKSTSELHSEGKNRTLNPSKDPSERQKKKRNVEDKPDKEITNIESATQKKQEARRKTSKDDDAPKKDQRRPCHTRRDEYGSPIKKENPILSTEESFDSTKGSPRVQSKKPSLQIHNGGCQNGQTSISSSVTEIVSPEITTPGILRIQETNGIQRNSFQEKTICSESQDVERVPKKFRPIKYSHQDVQDISTVQQGYDVTPESPVPYQAVSKVRQMESHLVDAPIPKKQVIGISGSVNVSQSDSLSQTYSINSSSNYCVSQKASSSIIKQRSHFNDSNYKNEVTQRAAEQQPVPRSSLVSNPTSAISHISKRSPIRKRIEDGKYKPRGVRAFSNSLSSEGGKRHGDASYERNRHNEERRGPSNSSLRCQLSGSPPRKRRFNSQASPLSNRTEANRFSEGWGSIGQRNFSVTYRGKRSDRSRSQGSRGSTRRRKRSRSRERCVGRNNVKRESSLQDKYSRSSRANPPLRPNHRSQHREVEDHNCSRSISGRRRSTENRTRRKLRSGSFSSSLSSQRVSENRTRYSYRKIELVSRASEKLQKGSRQYRERTRTLAETSPRSSERNRHNRERSGKNFSNERNQKFERPAKLFHSANWKDSNQSLSRESNNYRNGNFSANCYLEEDHFTRKGSTEFSLFRDNGELEEIRDRKLSLNAPLVKRSSSCESRSSRTMHKGNASLLIGDGLEKTSLRQEEGKECSTLSSLVASPLTSRRKESLMSSDYPADDDSKKILFSDTENCAGVENPVYLQNPLFDERDHGSTSLPYVKEPVTAEGGSKIDVFVENEKNHSVADERNMCLLEMVQPRNPKTEWLNDEDDEEVLSQCSAMTDTELDKCTASIATPQEENSQGRDLQIKILAFEMVANEEEHFREQKTSALSMALELVVHPSSAKGDDESEDDKEVMTPIFTAQNVSTKEKGSYERLQFGIPVASAKIKKGEQTTLGQDHIHDQDTLVRGGSPVTLTERVPQSSIFVPNSATEDVKLSTTASAKIAGAAPAEPVLGGFSNVSLKLEKTCLQCSNTVKDQITENHTCFDSKKAFFVDQSVSKTVSGSPEVPIPKRERHPRATVVRVDCRKCSVGTSNADSGKFNRNHSKTETDKAVVESIEKDVAEPSGQSSQTSFSRLSAGVSSMTAVPNKYTPSKRGRSDSVSSVISTKSNFMTMSRLSVKCLGTSVDRLRKRTLCKTEHSPPSGLSHVEIPKKILKKNQSFEGEGADKGQYQARYNAVNSGRWTLSRRTELCGGDDRMVICKEGTQTATVSNPKLFPGTDRIEGECELRQRRNLQIREALSNDDSDVGRNEAGKGLNLDEPGSKQEALVESRLNNDFKETGPFAYEQERMSENKKHLKEKDVVDGAVCKAHIKKLLDEIQTEQSMEEAPILFPASPIYSPRKKSSVYSAKIPRRPKRVMSLPKTLNELESENEKNESIKRLPNESIPDQDGRVENNGSEKVQTKSILTNLSDVVEQKRNSDSLPLISDSLLEERISAQKNRPRKKKAKCLKDRKRRKLVRLKESVETMVSVPETSTALKFSVFDGSKEKLNKSDLTPAAEAIKQNNEIREPAELILEAVSSLTGGEKKISSIEETFLPVFKSNLVEISKKVSESKELNALYLANALDLAQSVNDAEDEDLEAEPLTPPPDMGQVDGMLGAIAQGNISKKETRVSYKAEPMAVNGPTDNQEEREDMSVQLKKWSQLSEFHATPLEKRPPISPMSLLDPQPCFVPPDSMPLLKLGVVTLAPEGKKKRVREYGTSSKPKKQKLSKSQSTPAPLDPVKQFKVGSLKNLIEEDSNMHGIILEAKHNSVLSAFGDSNITADRTVSEEQLVPKKKPLSAVPVLNEQQNLNNLQLHNEEIRINEEELLGEVKFLKEEQLVDETRLLHQDQILTQKEVSDRTGLVREDLLPNKEQVVSKERHVSEEQLVSAEKELVSAEKELVSAEKELVSSEEQLVSAEQQLVSAEQQLVSAEQQLVSAEQQLLSEERQLVSEEQLVSQEQQLRSEGQLVREKQLVSEEKQLVSEEQQLVKQEQQLVKQEQQLVSEEQQLVSEVQQLVSEEQLVSQEQQLVSEEQQLVRQEQQLVRQEQQLVKQEQQLVSEEQQLVSEEQQVVSEEQQLVSGEQCTQESHVDIQLLCSAKQIEQSVRNGNESLGEVSQMKFTPAIGQIDPLETTEDLSGNIINAIVKSSSNLVKEKTEKVKKNRKKKSHPKKKTKEITHPQVFHQSRLIPNNFHLSATPTAPITLTRSVTRSYSSIQPTSSVNCEIFENLKVNELDIKLEDRPAVISESEKEIENKQVMTRISTLKNVKTEEVGGGSVDCTLSSFQRPGAATEKSSSQGGSPWLPQQEMPDHMKESLTMAKTKKKGEKKRKKKNKLLRQETSSKACITQLTHSGVHVSQTSGAASSLNNPENSVDAIENGLFPDESFCLQETQRKQSDINITSVHPHMRHLVVSSVGIDHSISKLTPNSASSSNPLSLRITLTPQTPQLDYTVAFPEQPVTWYTFSHKATELSWFNSSQVPPPKRQCLSSFGTPASSHWRASNNYHPSLTTSLKDLEKLLSFPIQAEQPAKTIQSHAFEHYQKAIPYAIKCNSRSETLTTEVGISKKRAVDSSAWLPLETKGCHAQLLKQKTLSKKIIIRLPSANIQHRSLNEFLKARIKINKTTCLAMNKYLSEQLARCGFSPLRPTIPNKDPRPDGPKTEIASNQKRQSTQSSFFEKSNEKNSNSNPFEMSCSSYLPVWVSFEDSTFETPAPFPPIHSRRYQFVVNPFRLPEDKSSGQSLTENSPMMSASMLSLSIQLNQHSGNDIDAAKMKDTLIRSWEAAMTQNEVFQNQAGPNEAPFPTVTADWLPANKLFPPRHQQYKVVHVNDAEQIIHPVKRSVYVDERLGTAFWFDRRSKFFRVSPLSNSTFGEFPVLAHHPITEIQILSFDPFPFIQPVISISASTRKTSIPLISDRQTSLKESLEYASVSELDSNAVSRSCPKIQKPLFSIQPSKFERFYTTLRRHWRDQKLRPQRLSFSNRSNGSVKIVNGLSKCPFEDYLGNDTENEELLPHKDNCLTVLEQNYSIEDKSTSATRNSTWNDCRVPHKSLTPSENPNEPRPKSNEYKDKGLEDRVLFSDDNIENSQPSDTRSMFDGQYTSIQHDSIYDSYSSETETISKRIHGNKIPINCIGQVESSTDLVKTEILSSQQTDGDDDEEEFGIHTTSILNYPEVTWRHSQNEDNNGSIYGYNYKKNHDTIVSSMTAREIGLNSSGTNAWPSMTQSVHETDGMIEEKHGDFFLDRTINDPLIVEDYFQENDLNSDDTVTGDDLENALLIFDHN